MAERGVDQLKELKRLQKENERLRRAISDLTLDKLILLEAHVGVLSKKGHRREYNLQDPHVY